MHAGSQVLGRSRVVCASEECALNAVTPSGFRDVLSEEARVREAITRAVADLFASRGYVPIETPTLEVMDVLRAGGRVPATPFKFFDSRGDLLAMRPDVTLQIARMCATRLAGQPGPFRFRYQERVFREAEGRPQAGTVLRLCRRSWAAPDMQRSS